MDKIFCYSKVHNFIWFQTIWFCAVVLREKALLALVALVAFHFFVVKDKLTECKVVLACASIGIFVDSALAYGHFYVFQPTPPILPIPLWLVALWFGFAGTLRHSLVYILRFPLVGSALASVSAPLTYIMGMRLGAVEFGVPTLYAALVMSGLWFVMMYAFIFIGNKMSVSVAQAPAPAKASTQAPAPEKAPGN